MLAFTRRALAIGLLTVVLAACKVVPDTRPGPAPAPTQAGPDANVLPTDTARHRVALLVPLSGENAAVGRSIANATTMALLDTSAENLRITTYDTATGAGTAAASAVRDGNKLILGPLVREDVTAVLAQARPADVPLITFSNDTSIAAPDVFVMGHIPEQSVTRTVAYASGQGARRFAALVPNGDYGRRTGDALARAVAGVGGTLATVEQYDRGNTSIVSAAGRLKAVGGYDAVLIAEAPRLAATAAATIREGGAQVYLLGTELWSGEASVASSAALRGALFSAVSDNRFRQFASSYQTRFGEQPFRLATLGYDAVLLTLRIARDWQPGRAFPTGRMLADDGFLGLDGPFRFRSNGIAERAMEVREVGNATVAVVDPAPTQF